MHPCDEQIQLFVSALLAVDRIAAQRVLTDSLHSSRPEPVIQTIVIPALEAIGEDWAQGEASLAQVYMAGRICEKLVDQILPDGPERAWHHPPIALAVVQDRHVLGKRIVYSMLRSAGYHVIDYGSGLTPAEIVKRTLTDNIELLLLSALMLPSALEIAKITAQLKAAGSHTQVIVGGAPFLFDESLWRKVGADAMGRSGADAVTLVRRLLREAA